MRRIMVIAVLALAVAPVAASVAAGGPNATTNASASCTALKAKIGATTFAQAYTSFGACVSALTSVEQQNIASAEAQCTAEQNDAGFAAAHGNKTFAQFYGTGKNGKDAFNKCVSAKTQASSKAEQLARTNPSRTCNTLRTRLGATHDIEQIEQRPRDPSRYPELAVVPRALRESALAERRQAELCWLACFAR